MSPVELLAIQPATVSVASNAAPQVDDAQAFGLALAAAGASGAGPSPGAAEVPAVAEPTAGAGALAALMLVLAGQRPQTEPAAALSPGGGGSPTLAPATQDRSPVVLTPAAFVELGSEPGDATLAARTSGAGQEATPGSTFAAPPAPPPAPGAVPIRVPTEAGLVRLAARAVEPASTPAGDAPAPGPQPAAPSGATAATAPMQPAVAAPASPPARPVETQPAPQAADPDAALSDGADPVVTSASTTPAPAGPASAPVIPGAALDSRVTDSAKASPKASDVETQAAGPALPQAAEAPGAAASDRTDAAKSALAPTTAATVQHLAAEIARRLEGRSTRFDLELHPADLGRVDVRLDVSADGRVQAQLAFDNPAAAADLRARADELRRSLEQAGFQIAREDLSFAERDGRESGFAQGRGDERPTRGRAFQGAVALADAADAPPRASLSRSALDVRV